MGTHALWSSVTNRRRTDVAEQIPLALRWPRQQRFDTFSTGGNGPAVAALRAWAGGEGDAVPTLLIGPADSGKTHLLVAACRLAAARGQPVQYLPLQRLGPDAADALHSSTGSRFLAIDDVHSVAGIRSVEQALFDVYNRALAERIPLLLASRVPPPALALTLPDLRSRLGACTQWRLQVLGEAERREVLRQRALARGMELERAVLDWLFTHYARDLTTLQALLDTLDSATLASQRRVTIPFLRQLLHADAAEEPADL